VKAAIRRCPINGVAPPPYVVPNRWYLASGVDVDGSFVVDTEQLFAALVVSVHASKAHAIAKMRDFDDHHTGSSAALGSWPRSFLNRFFDAHE